MKALRPGNLNGDIQICRKNLNITAENAPSIGIILGTGWGGAISPEKTLALGTLPTFQGIPQLEGHKRELSIVELAGQKVLALSGRIHLNECPTDNSRILIWVRQQVQLLIDLGVKKLILTNAAGSLLDTIQVGDVVVADSIYTLAAPRMPLFGGEFCNPEDTLCESMHGAILNLDPDEIHLHSGCYAMVLGPYFEGRKADKRALAQAGADTVGMSVLPELCIAALNNIPCLALSFITNTAGEVHSHQTNLERAEAMKLQLGTLLDEVVRVI
jgi:purine-nucleoside phosphorylase